MDDRGYGLFCSLTFETFDLANNLTLGYIARMKTASKAARELARLSVLARRRKWGKKGFREKLRAWGKLGGRPRTEKGNNNAD